MTIVGNAQGTINNVLYNFLKRLTLCNASANTKPTSTCPTREKRAFSYDEVYEMIEAYDAYLILDNDGDKKMIDRAKHLRAIANFGVGYNNIDWKYATQVGLPVVNTPTTVTEATAEHAVALLISTMRGIARYDREVRNGLWN